MIPKTRCVLAGCILAVYLVCVGMNPENFQWPLTLILLGALAFIPLGLRLAGLAKPVQDGMTLGTAFFLALSFTLPPGPVAAVLALGWCVLTWLIALFGLPHFKKLDLVSWSFGIAQVQLGVGGAWLLADRIGWDAFGFGSVIMRLTAAHFHFAGFILPLFVGFLLRQAPPLPLLRLWSIGVWAGVPLTALGITLTRLGCSGKWEGALSVVLCVFTLYWALCYFLWAQSKREPWLLASAFSLCVGTCFALAYALRWWWPALDLGLPSMWAVHGTLQVLGFAGCGMMGWWKLLRS